MTGFPSGLVLLNKPPGITSFKVLGTVKSAIKSGKVGHTGTLDKFAEGLMLVLTGKMTRLAPFFSNLDKEYKATFKFGEETTTLDPEGEISGTGDIPSIDLIKSTIENFKGKISQKPPNFSAIHINGKRAYKIAASGSIPDIPKREITIYKFEIIDWSTPYLKVNIKCSKGTYIRSIARDLGLACKSRAYVTNLQRTRVGTWDLENAILPDQFDPKNDTLTDLDLFSKIPQLKVITANRELTTMLLKGLPISKIKDLDLPPGITVFIDEEKHFTALVENENNRVSYRFVRETNR